MKFKIKIKSDCDDNGADMISDRLEHLAEMIMDGFTSGEVVDRNGNRVGWWEFSA